MFDDSEVLDGMLGVLASGSEHARIEWAHPEHGPPVGMGHLDMGHLEIGQYGSLCQSDTNGPFRGCGSTKRQFFIPLNC